MRVVLVLLILPFPVAAQYVPPVPIGIKSDAKIRAPRALGFPSEKLQWIRVRSPHFDVISSASAERTQADDGGVEADQRAVSELERRIGLGAVGEPRKQPTRS